MRTHCSSGVRQMAANARNVASTAFASFAGKLNSRAIAVVAKPGLLNTIFDSTKLHLANWFLGIYLVSQIARFRVEETVTDLNPDEPNSGIRFLTDSLTDNPGRKNQDQVSHCVAWLQGFRGRGPEVC